MARAPHQAQSGLIPAHAGKTEVGGGFDGVHWAHPRSRGENQLASSRPSQARGSSPLTRGKPSAPRRNRRGARLIPAHAGKTRGGRGRRPHLRAHPRSRGENRSGRTARELRRGSSPLTRGKLVRACMSVAFRGLIPAHAGKTPANHAPSEASRAHPRSRGENFRRSSAPARTWGSSPLTRGKPRRRCPLGNADGLIPAHAGKTGASGLGPIQRRAHPRSRGENNSARSDARGIAGSSPLTRGKLLPRDQNVAVRGLIPAHAGKTMRDTTYATVTRAHPRSRGENAPLEPTPERRPGSSPLTRGKLAWAAYQAGGVRLIPAHAGKTSPSGLGTRSSRAHPRSRGENVCVCATTFVASGSSPLTRGKLEAGEVRSPDAGLIPAHAGKTTAVRRCEPKDGAHPRSRGENNRM